MTEGQERTLGHVLSYFEAHGRGPTIRELMEMDKSSSTVLIHRRLRTLVDYGRLRKTAERGRCYVPNDDTTLAALRNCSTAELQAEIERRKNRHLVSSTALQGGAS